MGSSTLEQIPPAVLSKGERLTALLLAVLAVLASLGQEGMIWRRDEKLWVPPQKNAQAQTP